MKTANAAVQTLLAAAQANPDATLSFAECFLVTLATNGAVYAWTNLDVPVTYGGVTYSASGPMISGLKLRQTADLEVDKQRTVISARPSDLVGVMPVLVAIRAGLFDGAEIVRTRVFLTDPASATVIGGVIMFKGRVSTVDRCGRTQAELTVASDLVVLDQDMPRNLWSPTCNHVLYDTGCALSRAAYSYNYTCAAGSTQSVINCSGASPVFNQGTLTMTSGQNAGISSTVRSASVYAWMNLMYPLPFAPATGDAFTVSFGCDHTMGTCRGVFNNLLNFRGFPFIPPPEMAV